MNFKFWSKKAVGVIAAGAIGAAVTFFPSAMPIAEAGLLESLIGAGIQVAAMSEQINYFDDKGRDDLYVQMRSENGVNDDPVLNERLDVIMANLTAGIAAVDPSINEKPYNYFINPDTSFNAFCSLGNNISVNTGLFDLTNNDDEIAVVIAHEMAHGQKKHVKKGYNKRIPVILGSVAISEATGGLGGAVLGAVISNQLTAKSITKPQEWEADNIAFDYINNTDYNPGACAALWQRVLEKMNTEGAGNFVGEIFAPSDHPTNEQRRNNYSKKLTEMSDGRMTVAEGTITLNGKNFLVCAVDEENDMSAAERAYFIAGNLAKLYKDTNPKAVKKAQEKAKKEAQKAVEKLAEEAEENGEEGTYKKRNFSLDEMAKQANKGPVLRQLPQKAYVEDGMLFVDGIYIMNENNGEPSVVELADIFNQIK